MPFGLCNAPATFERLMESGLHCSICLIYLDDVIVVEKTFEMVRNLAIIFLQFYHANLKLKLQTCQLFKKEVKLLGTPASVTEVRSFLGLYSYYRCFIAQYSEIVKPLCKLTEQGTTFQLSADCDHAFQILKDKLATAPMLKHPDFFCSVYTRY